MADTKAVLKKALQRAKGVDEGTVIRFDVCFEADLLRRENAKRYNYAAIFTGGKWYLTGDRGLDQGKTNFTFEELMTILATDERVESVEVATGFELLNL